MDTEHPDGNTRTNRRMIEDSEVLIKSAEIDIKEAEKTGADLSVAKGFLEEAKSHLKNLNIKEVKISVKKATVAAADAKRYHRAELLIKHALPVVDSTRKAGADATKAEEFLEKAREALNNRMYGDLSEFVRAAKREANEAKRYHRAYLMILNCQNDVGNARMMGADVSEAEIYLNEALRALEDRDYGVVAQLVRNAKNAATKLQKHKKVEELIEEVKPDVEDLKRFGVRTEETEALIHEAEDALKRSDYAEVRSLVRKIKRRIKRTMERKGASVLIATIEHLIHRTKAKGIDDTMAKELLVRAEKALDKMDHFEIDQIISEVNTLAKALDVAVGTLAGDLFSKAKLVDLEKMDQVFSEAERKISVEMARARLTAMRDLMISARELGLDLEEFLSLLKKAEEAFESKDFDIIEEYKESFEEKLDEEKIKHRTEVISMKIKKVAEIMLQFQELGINIEKPQELLVLATNELKAHNFEKAEINVDHAEEVLDLLRRRHEIQQELESVKKTLAEAKEKGVDIGEANELLAKAESELAADNFSQAMELIEKAKNLTLTERRRHTTEEELESVRDTLSEAEAAGVDIGETKELLIQAENELENGNFNKAKELLEEARVLTYGTTQNFIQDKFPKLTLKLPESGMEADVWNRCIIEIANIGNLIAKNVDMTFKGNVEVKGVEKIEKLGIGEKRQMEIGVKPKGAGEVSLEVLLAYQRAFDETVYQLDLARNIIVDATGTYSVEDVLLIHKSGILIVKVSRKLEEDIDQDIFSGMLTAVQEFVRDSFRGREDTGLRRMDFAQNKILIEHGHHCYLTSIILGGEPTYLPLYMMEVLREVEQKYGDVLDGWRGSFTELEGVREIVEKLLNVTKEKGADVEGFESGVIAPTIKLIEAAREAEVKTGIPENFLEELLATMEKQGLDDAWGYLESVEEKREKEISSQAAKDKLNVMKELLSTAQELDLDLEEFLSMLEKAETAFLAEDFDTIEDFQHEFEEKFSEAKIKHRIEIIARRIKKGMTLVAQYKERKLSVEKPEELLVLAENELEVQEVDKAEADVDQAEKILSGLGQRLDVMKELESAKGILSEAKTMGIEVGKADDLLVQAENEISEGNPNKAMELINKAKEIIETGRRKFDISREMESVKETLTEAKTLGVEVSAADTLLTEAENLLKANNFIKAIEIVDKARSLIISTVGEFIKDKYPKITLTLSESGMEAATWNKCTAEIGNIGDLAAKNVDMTFKGNVEVKGIERIEKLGTGETKQMDIGLKPKEAGEILLEVLLTYQRAFDDTVYQLDLEKKVDVDASGTFLVEEIFLIHNSGLLVSQVSRKLEEDIDRDIFSGMLTAVQEFVRDSFRKKQDVGMKRMDFGENKIMLEHGNFTFLVTVLIGGEPKFLPLYMLEVLNEVEQKYGEALKEWDGTYTALEGLNDVLAKLMQVTDEKGADVEGFESAKVTSTIKLIEAAKAAGVEFTSPDTFAKELVETIENQGFEQAWNYLLRIGDEVEKSRAELKVRKRGIEELKHAFLRDMDEHLIRDIGDSLGNYLRIAEEIIEIITKTREEEGIKPAVPLKTVAIKSSSESVRDAILKLKNPVLEKLNTRNLEIIEAGMEWEGLNLEVVPDRKVIMNAYKQQASKVETLLKYQSPWKIKHGIETKGEYTLGVEGYPVKITPKMLSFKISTPKTVIVKEYSKETTIYIDKELTEDMRTESLAQELINQINEMRRTLNIKDEDYIETQILVGDKTAELLENWKEQIASKTRSYAVEFPFDDIFEGGESGYYVEERELDGEKAKIGIVVVEWE